MSTAGQDYMKAATSLVFFNQSSQSVPVGISDDVLFETSEMFFGLLNNDGDLPANIYLAPTVANATIIDNDGIQCRACLDQSCLVCRLYY